MIEILQKPLTGKKGVVFGIANEHSVACGCAQAFRALGAELAITYGHEKSKPYVETLAREPQAPIFLPCDMQVPGQIEAVFESIRQRWGRLDFALHAIAFAPKADLQGRLADCSRDGFLVAMDVFCHSFIRMARVAEPLMTSGGVMFTLTYYGAEKVIEHYDVMGARQGCLGKRLALSRLRIWAERNPRTCHFARSVEDACGLGARSFRRFAGTRYQAYARQESCQRRRCRHGNGCAGD